MTLTRTAVAAVCAALAVALAGCSPDDPPAPPSPTIEAADILADALAKTVAVDLRYSVEAGTDDLATTLDRASGIARTVSEVEDGQLTVSTDGSSLYAGEFDGITFRLQSSRLTAGNAFALFADPFPPATLLSGVASVTATADGSVEGSLDLTKATTSSDGAAVYLAYLTKTAGDRASDVAFKADIDDGYLVKLQVTLPNIDDGADGLYLLTLSAFATDVTNAFPAGANVVDAPDSMYEEG